MVWPLEDLGQVQSPEQKIGIILAMRNYKVPVHNFMLSSQICGMFLVLVLHL
jgi:hypothetical protein